MASRRTRRISRAVITTTGLTVSAATAFALVGSSASATPMHADSAHNGHASTGPVHASAPQGRRAVATRPGWTSSAHRVGTPAASTKHQLVVTLRTDQAAATAYAKSVSNPASANYRKFLTPGQYASRFGATPATVKKATTWLRQHGFTVSAIDHSHTYLTVTGSTTAVDDAFGAKLGTFRHEGATVTAPTAVASVPAATPIAYVVGLDTTPRYHTDHVTRAAVDAKLRQQIAKAHGLTLPAATDAGTDSVSGNGCSHYWGEQVRPYQTPNAAPFTGPLPTASCGFTPKALNKVQQVDKVTQTGKGVTVGITLWCDAPHIVADTNHWSKDMGVPQLRSGQVTIDPPEAPYGSYCASSGAGDYTETALDVQSIHGAAPGADIIYAPATEPDDAPLIDAFHRLVDNNSVDIISNSWGGAEAGTDPTTEAAFEQVFTQAATQGITILFSSGDAGDGSPGDGSQPPAPGYPASDPWITSVGGTNIGTTKSGSIAFESGWITAVSAEQNGTWGPYSFGYGGGGGVSSTFSQPYYQKGVVPPQFAGTTPMRAYPDLSNIADPATGYLVGYTNVLGNYTTGSVGGTSLASPRTAGQLALAIQQAGGRRLGFLNPVIYAHGKGYLTDLSSNATTKAYLTYDDSLAIFGYPPIPETVALNAQSLLKQSLTLAKGYDNLSGVGAVDNEKKLIALVNWK